jgi:hypothetical protein
LSAGRLIPIRSTCEPDETACALLHAGVVAIDRCCETQEFSALDVRSPTVPLAGVSPAARWKRTTDRRVPEPALPSLEVGTPTSVSQLWSVRTSPPRSPTRRTRAIDEAGADDANVADTASKTTSAPARSANARRAAGLGAPAIGFDGLQTTGRLSWDT